MACNNHKCECANCINDAFRCDGSMQCVCQPEEASCCCNK